MEERRKTITYIGGFEFPDFNAAAMRAKNNCILFQKCGYQTLAVGKTNKKDNTNESKGVSIITRNRLVDSLIKEVVYFINPFFLLTKKEKESDIFICYNYPSFALLMLKLYTIFNKKKVIGDLTEWYAYSLFDKSFNWFKVIDSFLRMRILIFLLDGNIVISNNLESYLARRKSILLPPLVKSSNRKELQMERTKPNELVFGMLGTFGSGKESIMPFLIALDMALEETGKKAKFLHAGESVELVNEYFDREKFMPKNLKIDLRGRITHAETLEILSNITFTVLYRANNRANRMGYSTKFAESVSIGTPIIYTPFGGHSDFKDCCGYLVPFTHDTLVLKDYLINISAKWDKDWEIYSQTCILSAYFTITTYVESTKKFLESI